MEEYVTEEDFKVENEPENGHIYSKFRSFILSPYWFTLVIILVGLISFVLGRLSLGYTKKEPVKVFGNQEKIISKSSSNISDNIAKPILPIESSRESQKSNLEKVEVVASKNGTKYHLPSCPGAKQISENNLIKFSSIEEAKVAGFTPASNCKGLK